MGVLNPKTENRATRARHWWGVVEMTGRGHGGNLLGEVDAEDLRVGGGD